MLLFKLSDSGEAKGSAFLQSYSCSQLTIIEQLLQAWLYKESNLKKDPERVYKFQRRGKTHQRYLQY